MGIPPSWGRRLLTPITLLLAIAAIAPASTGASLPLVDQVQSTVNATAAALPQPVQQTASSVLDPVDDVVNQAQGAIDQVQSNLGPAQGPTQGPIDQLQGTVPAGGGSGSRPSPAGSDSSPSSGSRASGSSGTPRAGGGSRTRGSRGSAVARRGSSSTRAAARRAAARRATAGSAAAAGGARATARDATPRINTDSGGNAVTRAVTKFVQVVPWPIKVLIALLAALAAMFGLRSWLHGRRARSLERQREELLGDVGLLQRALLPEVPERIGPLATSVAYRPADGPAAGGDFYDVFEIQGGKVAVIVGDVCGHGRQALAQTALIRYTLRAYIDAGLGPRASLQVAGRALANDLAGELTTVVVAEYDPRDATLTYACAGHEPPILLGPAAHEPVVAGAAPPVGAGVETGMRQTRVPLPRGSSACFFTDGLVEARIDGGMVGRQRLNEMFAELDESDRNGAHALLTRLAEDSQRAPDDMAACIVRAVEGPPASTERVEELEVRGGDNWARHAKAFLLACGVDAHETEELMRTVQMRAAEFGTAVLLVTVDARGTRAEAIAKPDTGAMVVLPPVQPGDASVAI